MKKITFQSIVLLLLLSTTLAFSQKVVIIGMNHTTPDGFAFVATEAIPVAEVIYFTEEEYSDATNNFPVTSEGVVRFTVTSAMAAGDVVFINESPGNTFTPSCSGGCGTAVLAVGSGNFALATNGDGLYAYSDTDDDPSTGPIVVYSVMYTGTGEAPTQNGGNIPANENPVFDHPTAVVVDGFPDDFDDFAGPLRVEYAFAGGERALPVSQASLENPTNYLSYVAHAPLSIVPFTNINLAGSNPVATVGVAPSSVNENSGTGMVYTFTLDAAAVGPITINFSVGGTATFTTDYTQSGANTFNASTGTVIIPNAATSATVTLTPVGDTGLEPDETAILTITAGTGYDAGAPSIGTGTILNDDTLAVTPVVAVTGGVHAGGTEGFSFVALDDITAGTEVFFTENTFDNSLLRFTGTEGVVRWIAPAGGVLRGEVIVATEGPANVFTTTCNSGTCGTVTIISGTFDYASNGEALFAYTDSDTDHTNGITAISAVLFTGTIPTPGGNIPPGEDPSGVYVGSVVVDGFPASPPVRTEYRFALGERGITVDQANFQNTANWLHAAAAATLDPTPFANIIIATGSVNPNLTLTASPTSTVEDSGVGMVYTFLLDAPAVGDITVNFTVAGTATFTTDYTQTGAATFAAGSGTAVILNGNTSVAVTITPVVDIVVEPQETVELMIASGTGYDGGSPNSATGTITNDDTSMSDPLVAITGMNHVTPDGFSFVAAKDIPASTTIYFTENAFNNTTLLFGTGEGVLAYTSPGAIIPAGDVIVIKETAPDVFSLTCNGNTGAPCGAIVLVAGNLAHDTLGETLYAYEDSDNDPANGVDDIYAVMFTGLSSGPSGGNIPASQDPSGIYLSALVIDGFPATAPDRAEYRFALGERAIPVGIADFEDTTNNWLYSQPNADLSPIPFANISIVDTTPPVITCPANATVECGDDTSPAATGTATATDDIDPTPTITFADTSVAGCGLTEVITRTWTATDDAGNSASCVQTITVVDTTDPTITCPADATVECGDDTSSASTGVATGTDGCGTVTITESDTSVAGCGLTEVITRTWTATDECGNTNTCVQTITVVDTTDPVVTCPANVTVECGDDTTSASTGVATGTDGCGTVTITESDSSAAGCGNTETITRTWTATDECGNTATCVQTITVVDTTLPTITCPADITVNNDAGVCGAVVTYTAPVGSDTCGTSTTIQIAGLGSGATFPVGSTTETYEVTDACGNVETCSFTVTVNDTEDPVVTCPADITVSNDPGQCDAVVTFMATATDNCPGVTTSSVPASGSVFPVGTTTVTVTATDASGNTDTCTFDVTVNDNEDPVAICPADITVSNDPGQCDAVVTFAPTATDNCPGVTFSSVPASGSTFPVGTTTVTVTATDAAGNTDTCTFDVTVNDNEDPVASCPADITVSNDPGQCDAVVTFAPSATDNCPGVTVSSVPASGSTFPVGTTTVTVTATDASGNTDVCTFDVTVNDDEDPVVTCPADITVSNDPGQCDAVVTFMATATDNCPGVTTSSVPASGSVFPVGTTTVTVTATDASGNTDTCTFDVTVNDDEDPVIICPADITVSNDPGRCDAVVTYATPVGTDNCPGAITTQIAGLASGSVFPLGTTTNTFEVVDAAGNRATCSFDVTVNDNEDPIIACPGDFNVSNDPGVCGAVVNYGIGFGDNCPGAVLTQTAGQASGTVFPIGTTTNTFVVTDASGNTATCSFDVTVNDTEPPVITCPADITVNNDPGVCEAVVSYTVTTSDNCPGETVVQTAGLASGSAFPVGTTTNTFVVTDASGNTATCSFDVTVIDNEDPVITCPADITVSNDPGVCGAVVNYTITATDNCDTLGTNMSSLNPLKDNTLFQEIPTNSNGAGQLMYVGQNGVGANNRGLLTFDIAGSIPAGSTITAVDLTMTADHPTASNGPHVFNLNRLLEDWGEGASDNGTVPGSPGGGFGVAAVAPDATWNDAMLGTPWAAGSGGNFNPASSAAQTVDVNGPYVWTSATLVSDVQDMLDNPGTNFGWAVVGNETGAGTTKRFGTRESGIPPVLTISYSSGGGSLTLTQTAGLPSGSVFPVGTTTNTFVVTDASGNSATCSFDVTVNDTEDPVITCPADITVNNDPGLCSAVVDYESTSSSIIFSESFTQGVPSGDCGAWNTFQGQLLNGLSYTSLTISGSMDPVGISLNDPAKVLQLADALRTNSTVTVVDGPNTWRTGGCGPGTEISVNQGICGCASNYSVRPCIGNLNWGGVNGPTCNAANQTMTVEFVHSVGGGGPIVGTDNCPGSTTVQTAGLPSGSAFPVGTTTNTFVVTDASGNTATCSFDVTVVDNEPPVANCVAPFTIQLDANGMASITPADIDNGSTDNCGIASLSVAPDMFTCADVGPNTVTLTVTDVNGNVSTCTTTVTVEDNVPPVAVCMDIDVFLDANGMASITPADVDGGSTDACGIASLAIDIMDFTCADIGPNNVTLTVTDNNGNVSTCVAVVTVIDDIPPTISCPADIFTSTDPDICGAIVTFPDALALDNCAVTVAQTGGLSSGDVFPVGVNTVVFTATDEGGNMTVCTFTVTVEDFTPPVAVCQDITIQLDANGDATITAADVDGGSFDNCGVITGISIDIDTFDCSDLGPNPVVLSVTDDNGNVGTCTAIVTVEDVTAPDPLCLDITVQLDAAGTVTIVATDVDGGSTDACGIDIYSIDIDTFTCADVGANPVVLTVTDASGNSSTCTAIVTVEDVTAPVVTCMDIEVGLDANGMATIVPADVIASATDACGVGTAALDISEFDCDDIGDVLVTVFITDINGNASTCTAIVTVKDGVDPVLTCPADLLVEVDEGTSYTVPDFIDDGTVTVTDNCTDPVTLTTQDPAPGTILPEGVYTVTMTAEDDYGNGTSCTFDLTVVGVLGGVTFDISTIVMYPNPATTEVRISNPQQIALKEALIFDLTGRIVGTYDLRGMGTDIGLDIARLATATYTVIIKGEDGQIVKQLVKE